MNNHLKIKIWIAIAVPAILLANIVLGARDVFWTETPTSKKNTNYPLKSESLAPLAKKTMPAVVTVYTKKAAVGRVFLMPVPYIRKGTGSGFIISADGYILTNNHVVEDSDSINVVVGVDRKKAYSARLIGKDVETDVALIKIEGQNLPVLPLGDSDKVEVGDWVAAIGSPFNFPHTFTIGIISAKGRRLGVSKYDDFFQTDASINSGNSGGPLINMKGEVIGINTLIVSPSGGNVGIGFSNAINLIKSILPQLRNEGKVSRSWLGVDIAPIFEDTARLYGLKKPTGARVSEVIVGSPADGAGIEPNDIIIKINGEQIDDYRNLSAMAASYGVGREAQLTLVRNNNETTVKGTLAKLPSQNELARLKSRRGVPPDNILGLGVRDLSARDIRTAGLSSTRGVLVTHVDKTSPSMEKGISYGDIITKINKTQVYNTDEFVSIVSSLRPGSQVQVSIRRERSNLQVTLKIGG